MSMNSGLSRSKPVVAPGEVNHSGGGQQPGVVKTYAAMLGSNLPVSLNKNVLEIVLEKDDRGSFNVDEEACARVMYKLGIDPRPGVHVEGVQICPNGRGIILVTLKNEVSIDRFCQFDVFEVTATGIRAVMAKPAGKREIILKIRGIHPNTRDEGVMDYLSKFTKVASRKVVYGVFLEGPLKGLRNGDRSYKMEVNPKVNIGTYHIIDGHRVTIRYSGQQQTCARCFQTAQSCPGRAIARKCEAEGGYRKQIGYSPSEVELDIDVNDDAHENTEVNQQEGGTFTPHKSALDNSTKYSGVTVKTFPKDTDHSEIVEFLISSGLKPLHMDNIQIKGNGSVTVSGLDSSECKNLIDRIHLTMFSGKKLYCNGIVPLTPEKHAAATSTPSARPASAPATGSPPDPPATSTPPRHASPLSPRDSPNIAAIAALSASPSVPPPGQPVAVSTASTAQPRSSSGSPYSPNSLGIDTVIAQSPTDNLASNLDVVRRHSLSLRSPPVNSIAGEILGKAQFNSNLLKVKAMVSDVKESLTDFDSCQSSASDDESSGYKEIHQEVSEEKGWQSQKKRKKSKSSSPPSREFYLKKKNIANSPKQQ